MLRFIVLFVMGLYAGSATAAQSTLLIVGDSLSAGYGLPENTGWVYMLQQRLKVNKISYRVVNASISGETSSGGRTRLNALLKQYQPSIMILQLGANDGLRGISVQVLRENLTAMIQSASAAKAKILLVGIRLPINYGRLYREKFQSVYADVAKRNDIALIPSLLESMEAKRELFQADGIHPSEAAQKLILETVWKKLEPLLRQSP